MKYARLVVANLFRKKTRTTLTVGSFAVALFLFGLLMVVHSAFSQGVSVDEMRRACVKMGMPTLRESGLRAIFNGHTTIEEVVRETVLEDD